ncbi:MAG: hypothetical protein NZ875_02540 [Pseudothermotoga sp.]|nr:hypothetical protein [Pseudothermotoga sp.]MDW8139273.1 hypothetical protein [Pseudothermotoga sp.]
MDLTNFEGSGKIFIGGESMMMEYLLAKIRWEELIKEAERERLLKTTKNQFKVLFGSNTQDEKAKQDEKSKINV